jgi:hypothetical protein
MRPNHLARRFALTATLALLAVPAMPQDLHPSRRPSPMGMARITVDDTYMRVVYSRPYKRDRDNIFGTAESEALVPFGEVWRTGANEATEITLTGDVMVAGKPLAAGTYSLLTVPGPESWTVHFNSALGLNGAFRRNPETGDFERVELGPTDVAVVTATVGTLEEEVDQFTIAFDEADGGADMCLRWITTEVCVPIRLAG